MDVSESRSIIEISNFEQTVDIAKFVEYFDNGSDVYLQRASWSNPHNNSHHTC